MKKLIAFMGLAGLFLRGRAQSFAEWFEQNKTEKKYLREQILALEEEDAVLEEGYAVDEKGLTRIGESKLADQNLHTFYFTTLKNVNPVIRADYRVDVILALTTETNKLTARIWEIGNSLPGLKGKYEALCRVVNEECRADLFSLGEILQDGVMQMSDKIRLALLGTLYSEAKMLYESALRAWKDATLQSIN